MKQKLSLLFILLTAVVSIKAQSYSAVWTQTAHPNFLQVNGVAFSSDGTRILSGTECHPSVIRTYDALSGNVIWHHSVDEDFYCLMGVGFSANTNFFAAVEEMGNILVFDNTQQPPVPTNTIVMGTSYAFSIDFAPNNCKMLVGGSSGKLQTYYLNSGLLNLNVSAHLSWVTACAYSPDNKFIASGGDDAKVKIWDTTGTLLHTLSSHGSDITALRFTADNSTLISASLDDKIKIWDVASGTLLQTIAAPGGDIYGLDVSKDGQYFATVSNDKLIRVYDLGTLQELTNFGTLNNGTPRCIAWSPTDNSKIAVGYSSGKVMLYEKEVSTVGISRIDKPTGTIKAVPQPFSGSTTIQWAEENPVVFISIYDESGKLLEQTETKAMLYNYSPKSLSTVAPGRYIAVCRHAAGQTETIQLLKK